MIKLLLLASQLAVSAYASAYPSVHDLEVALGLFRGAQIPKIVPANGRGWAAYYVGGSSVGNGEYAIRVRLRPQ